jgi:ribosomal protein S18 acetylase RimI-like enzyme
MASSTSGEADPKRAAIATTLRRANQRDCVAIRALLITTWHDAYDPIMGVKAVTEACDIEFTLDVLKRMVAARGPLYLGVLEQDGALVGVISMEISLLGNGKLYMLYVHPAYQGRGIGGSFLDYTPDIFPWAHSITLEVLEPNTPAIRFYEKGGFQRGSPAHRTTYGDVAVIHMRRDFTNRKNGLFTAPRRYIELLAGRY